jgi:hypothetical protein
MLSGVRSEAKERNEASHYSVQEGEFSRRPKFTNSIKQGEYVLRLHNDESFKDALYWRNK